MKAHRDKRRGAVLMTVIAVIILFGFVVTTLLQLTRSNTETSLYANGSIQAQLTAESGLQYAQSVYCAQEDSWVSPTTLTLSTGESIVIELINSDTQFRVTSTSFAGTAMESRAQVIGDIPTCDPGGGIELDPPADPETPTDFTVYWAGTVTGLDSAFIEGSVFTLDEVTFDQSGVEITGDFVADGKITLDAAVTIGGSLQSTEEILFLKSGTVVNGDVVAEKEIKFEKGATVTGSLRAVEAVKIESNGVSIGGDINTGKEVVIKKGASVGGDIFSDKTITIEGNNTSISGSLHATETIEIKARTTVSGSIFSDETVKLEANNILVEGSIHAGKDIEFIKKASVEDSIFAEEKVKFDSNGINIDGDVNAGDLVENKSNASITGSYYEGGVATAPTPPTPPAATSISPIILPTPQPSITTGTTDNDVNGGSLVLSPGTYRDLEIRNGGTVTFQASAAGTVDPPAFNYTFRKLQPRESTIRLDLSGSGNIHIGADREITNSSGAVSFEVSTDGSTWTPIQNLDTTTAKTLARRVYWEVDGNFDLTRVNSEWFGTVLTTEDMTLPDELYAVGSFAASSANSVINFSGDNQTIIYAVAEFAIENW